MKCPKCYKTDAQEKFCSCCGITLKEKCEECGKMEPVDRKVCMTALTEALEKREKFVEEAIKRIAFLKWFYIPPSKPQGAMSPQEWMLAKLFIFFISINFIVIFLGCLFHSLNFFTLPVPWPIELFTYFLTFSTILGPPYIMMIIIKKEKKETENFNQKFPELAEIIRISEEN